MSQLLSQQQLTQLKAKYQNEVKKNNNLLKMNSNLMKQNQIYQNCFSMLKKWNQSFISQWKNYQHPEQDEIDDSCIDIEEQGQEFIKSLTEMIQKKMNEFSQQIQQGLKTQRDVSQISMQIPQRQCMDCQRWKQLYIKQSKQTARLQKALDESSLFTTQKQLNIVKLKNDMCKLLQDYWTLYRKQLGLIQNGQKINDQNVKIHNKQTVRPKDKSKQKRSGSSGNKPKKTNVNIGGKQVSAFSKQKTSRNTKYSIQLNKQKQGCMIDMSNLVLPHQTSASQLSQTLNTILKSYSQVSKDYEEQNIMLKQQLRDFNQILVIYRQKQRNKLLLK